MVVFIWALLSCSRHKKDEVKNRFNAENFPYSIQVLNGVGKPGLARAVRNELISRGFDIMDYGDAKHFIYNKTVIIIRRVGKDIDIEKLEEILKIRKIYYQIRKNSDYDLQIIIGRDYKDFFIIE